MRKAGKKTFITLLVLILITAVGATRMLSTTVEAPSIVQAPSPVNGETQAYENIDETVIPGNIPAGIVSVVFVESSTGPDDGVTRLINSMQNHGIHFYQTPASPQGLIASNDVVLFKINAQWDERGGTNTDLIRAVIQAVLNHPGGFTGEIIVADNGQGNGGSLSWTNNNAIDRSQSVLSVVRSFQALGYRVSGVLWDEFTNVKVSEFNQGDTRNGFVVENNIRSTGLEISYPKFTTEFGTMVSFREGIWNPNTRTYNREGLKVINIPVLKAHWTFHQTGAVKNYMGVPSNALSGRRPHNSVGTGGMGTLMAGTRVPALNILDMIWIGPDQGPRLSYAQALQMNLIAASVDPVALDVWATRNVLMPEAARIRSAAWTASMDPTGTEPGTFGHWLRLSKNELLRAGVPVTMDEALMLVVDNR